MVLKEIVENNYCWTAEFGLYIAMLLISGMLSWMFKYLFTTSTFPVDDPGSRLTSRWTPLHYASQMGYVKIVETLLDAKAEAEPKNLACSTPLALATMENQAGAQYTGMFQWRTYFNRFYSFWSTLVTPQVSTIVKYAVNMTTMSLFLISMNDRNSLAFWNWWIYYDLLRFGAERSLRSCWRSRL